MPDPIFEHPRLARIYDPLDPDRSDLDAYIDMVDEFGAHSVLDLGCGTGTLACLLAQRGQELTGVDPAAASLDVARGKPGADRVRWLHGVATSLPPLQVDLVTITGNAAQVFLSDEDWAAALGGIHDALRPGGHLVFEVRDPAKEAWRTWERSETYKEVDIPGTGVVKTWTELTDVVAPFVSFLTTVVFADGEVITSPSTLRFRDREEIIRSLQDTAFTVEDMRDAPDRPGLEFVFVARRQE